ncbi:hypothetical protein B0T21DRAFT_379975 [Apiosordaria backusii]|uniref:Uncharacterized protein n=1 Tax=Apiosordaria backusii TaxID=314023 RepID=A0AA40EYT8_9PEZI|nr:hypothetical protein B0T21DRAFT_379975 [Apiosordaria backusii]
MMRRPILHSLSLLLCYISSCRAANKCYYPGGGESLDDVPCDPDAEVNVCCGRSTSGGGCLSNKLCMGTDGRMSRGSCTDKDWLSPECPNFCTGIVVTPCLNGNDSSTTHCCFIDRNCCNDESALFEAPPAQPVTIATWNSVSSRYVTVQPMTSTSSKSTSAVSTSNTAAPTESTTTTPRITITSSNSRYSRRFRSRSSPHHSSNISALEIKQTSKNTRASSSRKCAVNIRNHHAVQPSIWLRAPTIAILSLISAFIHSRHHFRQGTAIRHHFH